jgi:uncharacterized protein (TIGR00297 family)
MPLYILLIALLCVLISQIAYVQKVLTRKGSFAAFFIVFIIGVFGDISWLILLFMFTLISFLATKYKFALKEALGAQEGKKGERSASNVLANGLVPAIIAFVSFFDLPLFPKNLTGIVFISAVSIAAADTIASEIGILSDKTHLITNLESVSPGTEGGVSVLGELSGLMAAVFTSLIGYLVLFFSNTVPMDIFTIIIPVCIGFLGCHIDSVFGATLERRGIFNKHHTNFFSIAIGAFIAWFWIMLWFGVISF